MEPRSQKAAIFAGEIIFGSEYDHVMKQAVRHGMCLEELLEHSAVEKVWKEFTAGADEVAASVGETDTSESKQTALLVSMLPCGDAKNLHNPDHAPKREVAESAAEAARRQVSSQLRCVDGSQSLERLATQLREIDFVKLRGSTESSIFILYQVESAGEHERDSRRSPTPVRKDHMDKILKAILSTRGELPDWEANSIVFPALDPSDLQLACISISQTCHCVLTDI